MTTILEFTIDALDHELGRTLSVTPETTVELTPFVPIDGRTLPYVWADAPDYEAFADGVRQSELVVGVEELEAAGGGRLFRIDWDRKPEGLLFLLGRYDVMVSHAEGDTDRWKFRLIAPDREVFGEFQTACSDGDIPITISRLRTDVGREGAFYGLTNKQRAALATARRLGYFERGSDVTLADVGDALGVSRQAAGDRLNRAIRNLVDATIG